MMWIPYGSNIPAIPEDAINLHKKYGALALIPPPIPFSTRIKTETTHRKPISNKLLFTYCTLHRVDYAKDVYFLHFDTCNH